MRVLALESSCDETAVALYDSDTAELWDTVYTQSQMHALHGGVVPELASRDHIRHALPLIEQVLSDSPYSKQDIDAVAFTAGPGLSGALLVTAGLGRSLAFSLGKPAIGVHHMEGHLLAPMLTQNPPAFPFVALLVSGGHTLLVNVEGIGVYSLLGSSVDDAAGEAFDKTARLLGLGYPGGPAIAALAKQGRPGVFSFPRPMLHSGDARFSFSGLKTAVREAVLKSSPLNPQTKADIALAFEEAAIDVLCQKSIRATLNAKASRLVVAGGVSANHCLRQRLDEMGAKHGIRVFYPEPRFCTDNAAMIAYAGAQRLIAGQQSDLQISVMPRWPLDSLPPLSL